MVLKRVQVVAALPVTHSLNNTMSRAVSFRSVTLIVRARAWYYSKSSLNTKFTLDVNSFVKHKGLTMKER